MRLIGLPSLIIVDGFFAAEDNWAAMEAKQFLGEFWIYHSTYYH